jgi:hypothetical protein
MNPTIDVFKKNKDYAHLKDLKNKGIHIDTIKKLLDDKIIEKIKLNLYIFVLFKYRLNNV